MSTRDSKKPFGIVLCGLAALFACGPGPDPLGLPDGGGGFGGFGGIGGGAAGGSPGGGTGAGGAGGAANQPPIVVALSASGPLLQPRNSQEPPVIVSATVTDADGLGNLTGGTLHLASTGQTLGAFTGAVGTYSFSLSWGGTLPRSAINFGPGGGTLELEARFYDAASALATRSLTLSMKCPETPTWAACAGVCADFASSPLHCGRCDNPVPTDGICANGTPSCDEPGGQWSQCGSACKNLKYDVNNCGACGHSCLTWAASRGVGSSASCSDGRCYAVVTSTSRSACSTVCSAKGTQCLASTLGTAGYACTEVNYSCATVPPATQNNTTSCVFRDIDCACWE